MTTHALLSPSGRYRFKRCAAAPRACAQYQGEGGKSSPGAIDGTHSHTLLETCLKNNHPAKHYFGMLLTDHEGMFSPEHERILRAQVALDYIHRRLAEKPGGVLLSEERVDPSPLIGRTDMSGTCDVQLHWPEELEVIDYKDGMNPVSADGNEQLEQYVVGVMGNLVNKGLTIPFKTVRMTIIQPKLITKGMLPISSAEYPIEHFYGVAQSLIEEGAACDDPNAPFTPGEKQCAYCEHRPNCAAFREWAMAKAGLQFPNTQQPGQSQEAVPMQAASANVGAMTDDQLRELIESAPIIRKLLGDADEEALRRLQVRAVPGLKLVRGRGSRSWARSEEETAASLTRMGIPKKDLYKVSFVSPSQVEKMRWVKKDKTGNEVEKQLSEKQLERLKNELVATSEGKLTVALESDHRKDIGIGNLSRFFQSVQPVPAKETEAPLPDWMR